MDILISGHKMNVGEALTDYARERLGQISDKYFARAIDARGTFSKVGHSYHVDISMHPNQGINLRAEAEAGDAHTAFDAAADRVEKQLRRYKRRLKKHHQGAAREVAVDLGREAIFAPEAEDPASDSLDILDAGPAGDVAGPTLDSTASDGLAGTPSEDTGADTPLVIAEEETRIPHVSVRDAVMLMDFASREALMFKNTKTGELEVVYRRSDGNIGWISGKA